jgi:hypothetical protein
MCLKESRRKGTPALCCRRLAPICYLTVVLNENGNREAICSDDENAGKGIAMLVKQNLTATLRYIST